MAKAARAVAAREANPTPPSTPEVERCAALALRIRPTARCAARRAQRPAGHISNNAPTSWSLVGRPSAGAHRRPTNLEDGARRLDASPDPPSSLARPAPSRGAAQSFRAHCPPTGAGRPTPVARGDGRGEPRRGELRRTPSCDTRALRLPATTAARRGGARPRVLYSTFCSVQLDSRWDTSPKTKRRRRRPASRTAPRWRAPPLPGWRPLCPQRSPPT